MKINQLSLQDAIYIAGLFDGEGCIMLLKQSRLKEQCKTPTYILRVVVKMSNEDIIKWLHATIGGRFYSCVWPKAPQYKSYYQWGIAGKNAITFLRQIYPYLRVKRLQAEVAFKYGKTYRKKETWQLKLSDKVITEREHLRSKMLLLNQRGVVVNNE